MNLPPTALAHGAMLAFTALIATSFTVGGLIASAIAPEAVTFVRFLVAGAVFLAIAAGHGGLSRPGPAAALRYTVIGFLLAVYFITMFEALRVTDPLSVGAVFTLVPFMSALIDGPLNGQRASARIWAGLAIGCLGAVWIVFDADIGKLLGVRLGSGEAIFLVGCVAYAAYSPAVKNLHRGESLTTLTFFAIVAGAALTGLYGASAIAATAWASLPWWVYLGIAHLGIFTTAISFSLIKFASLRLPAAKVMAYTYLLPALVAAYEGAIGHGWPALPVLAGIAVTAAAVAVIETG